MTESSCGEQCDSGAAVMMTRLDHEDILAARRASRARGRGRRSGVITWIHNVIRDDPAV
jgi:hypothetical protein